MELGSRCSNANVKAPPSPLFLASGVSTVHVPCIEELWSSSGKGKTERTALVVEGKGIRSKETVNYTVNVRLQL